MSKKIAAGAKKIVLEVTCGEGAFMKKKEEAINLSTVMKEIGKLAGIETVCVITNMEQPIGKNIGNSLEIEEAINSLKGNMEKDVEDIVISLTSQIVKLSGIYKDEDEIKRKIMENIKNGKACEKFKELVYRQGGDVSYLKNIEKAKYIVEVKAEKGGYVTHLNAEKIGKASVALGAGRIKKEDNIDHTCGIVLEKKIGDIVKKGEILAYIHSNKKEIIEEIVENIKNAYTIGETKPEKYEHILGVV